MAGELKSTQQNESMLTGKNTDCEAATVKVHNHRMLSTGCKEALWGLGFVLVWIVGFAMFTAYPIFYSLWLSFNKVNISIGKIETSFIGMDNYLRAFTLDTSFLPAFTDTIVFIALSTPMILVFSTVIAICLNQKMAFRPFFRAVFFLPFVIISGSVISELSANGSMGLEDLKSYALYQFIQVLPGILSKPILYVFDNVVLILWFSSVQVLLIIAGLQKIDKSFYEAAYIDGASGWECFWKITLPTIKPMLLINAIYTVVSLSSFSDTAMNQLIQLRMFEQNIVYSYSSAISWMCFLSYLVIIGVFALVLRKDGAK